MENLPPVPIVAAPAHHELEAHDVVDREDDVYIDIQIVGTILTVKYSLRSVPVPLPVIL